MNLLKKLTALVAMFAVVSSLALTSCSNDDEDHPAAIAGTYGGTFSPLIDGDDPTPAEILLEKSGANLKLTLKKSAFSVMLPEGTVVAVDNIIVTKVGDKYKFVGQGLIDVGTNNVPQNVPLTVTGEGTPSSMSIKVNVPVSPEMIVDITFTGARK